MMMPRSFSSLVIDFQWVFSSASKFNFKELMLIALPVEGN